MRCFRTTGALACHASVTPWLELGVCDVQPFALKGLLTVLPGLWSLVKRAPKASVKRKAFEVEGPGVADAVPLNVRARAIFDYFKKYNYEVGRAGSSHARSLGCHTVGGAHSAARMYHRWYCLTVLNMTGLVYLR